MTGPDTTDTIEAPPCPPAVVEDMFRIFDKAVKARQLYMPNNPTYQKALANVKAAIEPLWDRMGSLVLQVTDTQLKWYGKAVNEHPEKGGDSLPRCFSRMDCANSPCSTASRTTSSSASSP